MNKTDFHMQALIDHLQQYHPLQAREVDFMRQKLSVKKYQKGAYLLEAGQISKAFFYNLKGCVRLFYPIDGEEKTAFFYTENSFISSYDSFTQQQAAKHSLQAIEDCELVLITAEATAALLSFSPTFDSLARIFMEKELALYQEIVASFILHKPEQRYLAFVQNHPDLIQRIPQYYIASYLGVNAETLSRIRKRIWEKQQIS